MKIACFGDVHVDIRKEFNKVTDRSGSSRLDIILDGLRYIKDYCIANSIDTAVCAGDLYNTRGKVNTLVFNETFEVCKEFSDEGIHLILVAGNHDQIDNSDVPQSSLRPLAEIPRVTVVEDCRTLLDPSANETVRLHCVPYSKNTQMIKDFIDSREKEEGVTDILVAHLGVSGATVGNKEYPMQDAFALSDLRPDFYKYVALGHYHDKQMVGGTNNVFYTGSPVPHTFGDMPNKGFYVIDTEKRWDVQFVPIPSPEFYTVNNDISTEDLEYHRDRGDYIRVQITESEVESFESRIPEGLMYKIDLQREYVKETRVDIQVGMSFEQIVSKYADELNPDAKSIGLDILREANEE